MNNIEQLRDKILNLDQLIKSQHPGMPTLLREIHQHMREDPECVTLVSEDEILIVVQGLQRHTNAVVTDNMLSSARKPAGQKRLAKLNDDDLGLD